MWFLVFSESGSERITWVLFGKREKKMIVVKSWKKMGKVGQSLGKLEEKRDGV